MDIMVEGTGSRFYKPDEVEIDLNFTINDISYEKVLEKGVVCVETFIKDVLDELKINKEELKTRNFKISHNVRYDYETKKEIDHGFDYNQKTVLKMDYDMTLISTLMEKIAKLEYVPKYIIKFSIKDKENAKKWVMADAYNQAKCKAEIIAESAGKKLKDCVKVDFRPFQEHIVSKSNLNDVCFMEESNVTGDEPKRAMKYGREFIENIFTPEDVEITEKLYCLWITE